MGRFSQEMLSSTSETPYSIIGYADAVADPPNIATNVEECGCYHVTVYDDIDRDRDRGIVTFINHETDYLCSGHMAEYKENNRVLKENRRKTRDERKLKEIICAERFERAKPVAEEEMRLLKETMMGLELVRLRDLKLKFSGGKWRCKLHRGYAIMSFIPAHSDLCPVKGAINLRLSTTCGCRSGLLGVVFHYKKIGSKYVFGEMPIPKDPEQSTSAFTQTADQEKANMTASSCQTAGQCEANLSPPIWSSPPTEMEVRDYDDCMEVLRNSDDWLY